MTDILTFFIDQHGCAKNQVDGELIISRLLNLGMAQTFEPAEADLIVVNSCGFIESAKKESLDAVCAARRDYPNAKILLCGCLAERYSQQLKESLPEADGIFGKTESGNIWLDRNRTTPYAFYQFWLNVSDDDAEKYIKIFTDLDKETIDALVEEHKQDPGRRVLQKRLAEEVTVMVHSQEDLDMAIAASNILFGKATKENLAQLDEATLNDVFANVPHYDLDKNLLGGTAVDLFNQEGMQIFPSKSEMRKLVKGGGVSLNKEKLAAFDQVITADDLIDGKYLLVQKGKKNYFLITVK